jgi:hypothetical protein
LAQPTLNVEFVACSMAYMQSSRDGTKCRGFVLAACTLHHPGNASGTAPLCNFYSVLSTFRYAIVRKHMCVFNSKHDCQMKQSWPTRSSMALFMTHTRDRNLH